MHCANSYFGFLSVISVRLRNFFFFHINISLIEFRIAKVLIATFLCMLCIANQCNEMANHKLNKDHATPWNSLAVDKAIFIARCFYFLCNIDVGPLRTYKNKNSGHIRDVRLLDVLLCIVCIFFYLANNVHIFLSSEIQKHTVKKSIHFHVENFTQRKAGRRADREREKERE